MFGPQKGGGGGGGWEFHVKGQEFSSDILNYTPRGNQSGRFFEL